jgi:pyruvate/2-oxoglutarate dehydrogenase complex dihydrolipoamide acyltransferase (E2) component
MSHEQCKTVRVQAWGQKQGDFVEINESDFDEKKHKLYEGKEPTGAPPKAQDGPKPVINDGIKWADDAAREAGIASGLDFSKVKGTGKKKAVTVEDVNAAIEAVKPKINFASDEAGEFAIEVGLEECELTEIVGTGTDGAITVEDLQNYIDNRGKDNDE